MEQRKNDLKIARLKEELGRAIEGDDIDTADLITAQLLKLQGLRSRKKVPKGFAERIAVEGTGFRGKREKRKLLFVLAAVLVLMFSVGVISYAAGIFFPYTKNRDGSVTPVNALQESVEFKAAQEYHSYLDHMTEEEWVRLADTSESAIYDVPSKVEEICRKYNLKFATTRTEFSSYGSAEQQLERMGMKSLLGIKLREALKEAEGEIFSGYMFDDGNLHMEVEVDGRDSQTRSIISIDLTPEGSFPWTGFAPNMGGFDEGRSVDLIQSESGLCFPYIEASEKDSAKVFNKVGKYYITLGVSKALTGRLEQVFEKERTDLMEKLDQTVRTKTGCTDYESLAEKFAVGLGKAVAADAAAVQKAEEEHNWERKRSLLLEYGELTETELDVFDECEKKIANLQEKSDQLCILTRKDMEEALALFDFESLQKR